VKKESKPNIGAVRNLLRLFFQHPFPVFPLADHAGRIIGVVRRREVEALLNQKPSPTEVDRFFTTCRERRITRDELSRLQKQLQEKNKRLPLVSDDGQVLAYWGETGGKLKSLTTQAPSAGWPLELEFSPDGIVKRVGTPVPPGWEKVGRQAMGRLLGTVAYRLETACRERLTHGFFRRTKRRYIFSFFFNPDGGGRVQIEPLVRFDRLLGYLQEEKRGLPDLAGYIEKGLLLELLATGIDKGTASILLGLPRQTLHYKIKKHRC